MFTGAQSAVWPEQIKEVTLWWQHTFPASTKFKLMLSPSDKEDMRVSSMPEERRKNFSTPLTPGNYPGDVVRFYRENFNNTKKIEELFSPERLMEPGESVILAVDIRNFTKTFSECTSRGGVRHIYGFLN